MARRAGEIKKKTYTAFHDGKRGENGGGNGGWSVDDQRMHSYDRVRQRGIGRHSSLHFKFWYEYDIRDGRE